MGMLNHIWYGKEEPPRTNVLWARPTDGGFAFYIFDGKWKPQKIMDDKSTASTEDDAVLPLEQAEINEPYSNVYIGVGEEIADVMLPANLYESIKRGDTIPFENASGYLYAIRTSDRLPKLMMNNYLVPANTSSVVMEGVTYYVSKSENSYGGSFTIEVN